MKIYCDNGYKGEGGPSRSVEYVAAHAIARIYETDGSSSSHEQRTIVYLTDESTLSTMEAAETLEDRRLAELRSIHQTPSYRQ